MTQKTSRKNARYVVLSANCPSEWSWGRIGYAATIEQALEIESVWHAAKNREYETFIRPVTDGYVYVSNCAAHIILKA
jgi:hypothetical protein